MNTLVTVLAAILAVVPPLSVKAFEREIVFRDSYVLETVRNSGFQVLKDAPQCPDVYGLTYLERRVVVICLEKHDNLAELEDTIRHEAIHAVQSCLGGTIAKQEGIEEEAKTLAASLENWDVIKLLRRYC